MSGSGSGGGGASSSSSSSSSPKKRAHRQLPPPIKPPSPKHGSGLLPPRSHAASQTPPLLLTVRFSTSRPDTLLDIPHPNNTTVAALKHLIRSRLEQPDSQRRLRFIHGGKILPDAAVLGAVLKALPPPPRADDDPKGKGKAGGDGPQRVYVICSIGDLLTDAELDEERRRAEEPVVPDKQQQQQLASSASGTPHHRPGTPAGDGGAPSVQRGPRGFDRLLAAGFSAAEVNQLRLQFRSIQEANHTADTMPSPDTLRGMEDAWMDNDNGGGAALAPNATNTDGEEGEPAPLGDEFGLAGVLDLLLKGMLIGFVWPLGAVGWLVRGDEEKIPKRMRVFVYFGFVLSLLIGTIRTIG